MLIRADSDKKKNKQTKNNSNKINIKTKKRCILQIPDEDEKTKTYEILSICEELNLKLIVRSHNHIVALYDWHSIAFETVPK